MHNRKVDAQPLVPVIIPNYNYGGFIPDCINSVLNQDYPRVGIIVVDDGSTDESVNIVKRYGNAIKLFQIRNSGVSAARNHGIRAAKGEFICFLDSDDTWEPKKYRCSLKKFLIIELDWYIQV